MQLDFNMDISFLREQSESFEDQCQHQQSQTLVPFKKDSADLTSYQLHITRVDPQSEENRVTELIEQFELPFGTSQSNLNLNQLLSKIQEEGNFHFQGHLVMLYSPTFQLYTNFGLYPFTSDTRIDIQEYVQCTEAQATIKIKVHKLESSLIHFQMFKNTAQLLLNGPPKQIGSQETDSFKETKKVGIKNFQKIGYIVKAVMWHKLGRKPAAIQNLRFKLDRKFSKKSIEDYFNQIKLGYKYSYDFNMNSEQNMSHLRNYVKLRESEEKARRNRHQEPLAEEIEPISNLLNHN